MIERLMKWLGESTSNFMAAATIKKELDAAGFKELHQNERWQIKPEGKYYLVKNGSALFAFTTGQGLESVKNGFNMIAAHSDSPCLRLKPNPEIYGEGGVVALNVEKYGGGILYTWFDRPLSMSGRLMVRSDNPLKPDPFYFDFEEPIAVVPHLAIHFNRNVNEGNMLSVQKDMKPVIGYFDADTIKKAKAGKGIVLSKIAEKFALNVDDILDYDISLYPVVKPCLAGVDKEYLMSGRIDDLSMAFAGLEALLATADVMTDHIKVLAVFDNEETGSQTRQGAASPVLRDILERVTVNLGGDVEDFKIGMANSFMISADDAHAWHPNYNEKYDPTNHPVIGGGPVIKINANGKYMTDSFGAGVFKQLCEKAGVHYQMFVNHSDVAGGSTLGNILTSQMDLNGVDVGSPIWAMHSAVESAGVSDHIDMVKVFETFWGK